MLSDIKKSISDNFINSIESRLDKLIITKLNTFADSINNKFVDLFSFVKKQTDDLEELRKKNAEVMTNLTNLIIQSQEKKCGTFLPPGQNAYIRPSFLQKFPPGQMINSGVNNYIRPNNWGYPSIFPMEYMNNISGNKKDTTTFNKSATVTTSSQNLNNKNNNQTNNCATVDNNQVNNYNNRLFSQVQQTANKNNMNHYYYMQMMHMQNLNKDNINQENNQINSYVNNFVNNYELPPSENKYKEDEIAIDNFEKKMTEIENEGNKMEINLSSIEKDKQAINYSSDSKVI